MAKKSKRSRPLTISLRQDQEWIRKALGAIAKKKGKAANDVLIEALQQYLAEAGVHPPPKREGAERGEHAWIYEDIPAAQIPDTGKDA